MCDKKLRKVENFEETFILKQGEASSPLAAFDAEFSAVKWDIIGIALGS